MKIFIDTNVIIDWLLDRQNCFATEATEIISLCERKIIEAYISHGSLYTIVYVLEKAGIKGLELRNTIKNILMHIQLTTENKTHFLEACKNELYDLEDSFQFVCAKSINGIEYLVTGNLKDFKKLKETNLKIVNPLQFLKYIQ